MFFVAIAEKNQTFHFREKRAFTLNALFSRKYRFYFRSETEKQTSGASGTASGGRTPGRRSGGAKPRQAKPLPRTSGASERRREASGARRPSQGRASGASEHLPTKSSGQQLGRREVQSLCSLFAFLGGSNAPHWRRDGKETERNGGRTAFLLSFVHEYGSLIAETLEVCQFYSRNT